MFDTREFFGAELSYIGPVVRTPASDLFNPLVNKQGGSRHCANIEMMLLNCLEQYGFYRGRKTCRGYWLDLTECNNSENENKRVQAMREERERQFKAGERTKQFEPAPPLDAY